MKKTNITNQITPCCGLPFSVVYWWVSNLTLNSPTDREFILTHISQGGTISIDAWKILINSGTLETDAVLTKEEFLAWFECKRQPSCEQLTLIIENYKISNYNPIDQYGVGWTEQSTFETYQDKIIKKVTGYVGGINPLPAELQDNINKYYAASGGFTLDQSLATNFKPPVGSAETTFDPDNNINSGTMKATYNASETLVNKAFEEVGAVSNILGKDTNHASVAADYTPNFYQFNKKVLPESATFKKLKIWSGNSATLNYFHINYDESTNTVTVKESFTESVVTGLNEIVLDLSAQINDTIAIQPVHMDVGYTSGSSDISYSNGQTPPFFNAGYLAYIVEYETQGQSGYTVDEMRGLFDKVAALPDNLDSVNLLPVSRITIEGQSNALGVGFKSGLNVPPFSDQAFDWSKYFSRVYIWNPKNNTYENIKIGVNNMASWDSDYTIGAPTPEPTFGPEIGIALLWLQTNKSGLLFIDKNVGDGMPISYFQKGDAYYSTKLLRRTNADNWLKNRGFTPVEIGFVWVQGEGDYTQTKAYYKNQLSTLINDRKNDNFIKKNTNIIITQIYSGSSNYGAGVANAKSEYVSENLKCRLVLYKNAFNPDNVHLNTSGQISLGLDSGKEIIITEKYDVSELDGEANWTY